MAYTIMKKNDTSVYFHKIINLCIEQYITCIDTHIVRIVSENGQGFAKQT